MHRAILLLCVLHPILTRAESDASLLKVKAHGQAEVSASGKVMTRKVSEGLEYTDMVGATTIKTTIYSRWVAKTEPVTESDDIQGYSVQSADVFAPDEWTVYNGDCPGNDVGNAAVAQDAQGTAECATRCKETANCVSFGRNLASNSCWLKKLSAPEDCTANPGLKKPENQDIGSCKANGHCWYVKKELVVDPDEWTVYNGDCPGNDVGNAGVSKDATGTAECAKICKETAGCKSFGRNLASNSCWLKKLSAPEDCTANPHLKKPENQDIGSCKANGHCWYVKAPWVPIRQQKADASCFASHGSAGTGAECLGPSSCTSTGPDGCVITPSPAGWQIEAESAVSHHLSMVLSSSSSSKWTLRFDAKVDGLPDGAHYGTLIDVAGGKRLVTGKDLKGFPNCEAGTGWHSWVVFCDGSTTVKVYCDGDLVKTVDEAFVIPGGRHTSINLGAHYAAHNKNYYSRANMAVKDVELFRLGPILHWVQDCNQCGISWCGQGYSKHSTNVEVDGIKGSHLSEWGCDKVKDGHERWRNDVSGRIYAIEA